MMAHDVKVDEQVRPDAFVEASDHDWIDLGKGVRRRVRLNLPQMMMVEVAFEAGAIGALHSHPHVQCSYIERGAFDVSIGGLTRRLTRGGAYIVPPNVRHGVVAIEAGLLIDVFAPRRDDFIDNS
jgi:unsaturated pyranuronate lyase